jgi:hypothetical protein
MRTLAPCRDPPALPARVVGPGRDGRRHGRVDRLATDDFGIDLLQMMELAGSHLAEVVGPSSAAMSAAAA